VPIGFTWTSCNYAPPLSAPLYEVIEASFQLSGLGTAMSTYNPFNPKLTVTGSGSQVWRLPGVHVDALIERPDNSTFRWPCFYDYARGWKLRFYVDAPGTWRYKIEVRMAGQNTYTSNDYFIDAVLNTNPVRQRGPIIVDSTDKRFFRYLGTNECFHPIGAHVQSTSDVAAWGAQGGNWVRTFSASWMVEQNAAYPDHVCDFQEAKATTGTIT